MNSLLSKYFRAVETTDPMMLMGQVSRVEGLRIETDGPPSQIGEVCRIFLDEESDYRKAILGEIVGFRNMREMYVMPYHHIQGISPGCLVKGTRRILHVPVGPGLLGRVIDGLGNPIDQMGPIIGEEMYPVFNTPPDAMTRPRITFPIATGIRIMDSLFSIGEGQRVGIFAGSGVGKSTLLGMIARNIEADVNVIALIGERGREVREFIEKDLGLEGLKKTVLVVATSDTSPLMRIRAAHTATTIAEYFRDQNKKVVLMMDSLTRFARAQREIGLATGEPPTAGAFPPSVFTLLPELLERAGTSNRGSITGFYAVLVEGDDFNEPITDTVRGILDGHIYLDRELANRAFYPAIDISQSISRAFSDIVTPEHVKVAMAFRESYTSYKDQEDLINIGAYQRGTNFRIDQVISKKAEIEAFLKQDISDRSEFDVSFQKLRNLNIR